MHKKLETMYLTLLLTLFLVPSASMAERRVSVLPDLTVVTPGIQFSLEIVANDSVKSLMGFNVTVKYEPSFLEVVSVEAGALLRDSGQAHFFYWLNPACGCDSILVNGSILGGVVDGPGALFKITFKAIKVGEIPVVIHESDLRNGENQSLAHKTQNGLVTVESPIGSEHSSWSRLKSIYR